MWWLLLESLECSSKSYPPLPTRTSFQLLFKNPTQHLTLALFHRGLVKDNADSFSLGNGNELKYLHYVPLYPTQPPNEIWFQFMLLYYFNSFKQGLMVKPNSRYCFGFSQLPDFTYWLDFAFCTKIKEWFTLMPIGMLIVAQGIMASQNRLNQFSRRL